MLQLQFMLSWQLLAGTAMQLLAATVEGSASQAAALAEHIPLLLPYFRHTLASVRHSCVECLIALLQSDATGEPGHPCAEMSLLPPWSLSRCQDTANDPCWLMTTGAAKWPIDTLSSVMRLTFQNLLHEDGSNVKASSQQLWKMLLRQLPPAILNQAMPAQIVKVRCIEV